MLPALTKTSGTGSLSTGRPHFNSLQGEQYTLKTRQRWREGHSEARQGMQATTRPPTNITETQFRPVTHLRGRSGAKGQALCTLLLVWLGRRQWGWGGTSVEGAACSEPPREWPGGQRPLERASSDKERGTVGCDVIPLPPTPADTHRDTVTWACWNARPEWVEEGQSVERKMVIRPRLPGPVGIDPKSFTTCSSCL